MKSKFEQSIKDSLEGFELPYDTAAWTAMSQKLDAIQPVAPPKGGAGKWFAAAGIVIATTVGVVYFTRQDQQTETNHSVAENKTTNGSETDRTQEHISSDKSGRSADLTHQTAFSSDATQLSENGQSANTPASNHADQPTKNQSESGQKTPKNTSSQTSPFSHSEGTQRGTELLDGYVPTPNTHVLLPDVKNVCVGDQISLRNDNDFDLILLTPNRDEVRLKPRSTTKVSIDQSGNYSLIRQHLRNNELATFKGMAAPKLDFSIDDQTHYEQGVPSIPVETYSEGSHFTWSFEGTQLKQYGEQAHATFFKKGNHSITLTAQGDNGCKSSITKTVEVSEDYNLLAPNAFIPEHSDNRKNRFIPYALSVRAVEFNMIIIDPKSGVTVFESSDTQGWDGIDRTTGRMVDANATYIWKVVLKNPLLGERAEYSGTVAVLQL